MLQYFLLQKKIYIGIFNDISQSLKTKISQKYLKRDYLIFFGKRLLKKILIVCLKKFTLMFENIAKILKFVLKPLCYSIWLLKSCHISSSFIRDIKHILYMSIRSNSII